MKCGTQNDSAELISRLGIPLVQKKSLVKMGIYTVQGFLDFNDDTYVIGKNIIEWKSDEANRSCCPSCSECLR